MGGPFVTGSHGPDNLKTEYHHIQAGEWVEQAEYPFANDNQ